MNPKYCFDQNKTERTISGKCLKIVPLRNNTMRQCCLLIVSIPDSLTTYLLEEKEENPDQLAIHPSEKKLNINVTDAMQISFQGKFIVVESTQKGKLVCCQTEKGQLIYSQLCQLNSKSAITAIGFLDCGSTFNLFMLDVSGDLWGVQAESLPTLKKDSQIVLHKRNIVLMKTASDFSSVVLLDQEGEIHLLVPSSSPSKCTESFVSLAFNMNENYNSLLKPSGIESLSQSPILSEIVAFDYTIKNQILKVYATDNTNLIAIECAIHTNQSQSTFDVALLFRIDQTKGVVNQIFAYGNGGRPSFIYEIAIVQEKCVSAYNITNELSQMKIWQSDSKVSNPQLAYLYEFDRIGTKNRHLLHYIPFATEELKQNKQKAFPNYKYDALNGKISAFYLEE